MEKKEFAKIMTGLGTVYNKEFKPNQVAIWYEFLKDVNENDLKEAVSNLIKTNKFLPTIAEIRQEITKRNVKELSLNAEDEWEEVRKAIRNFDIYDSENALASLKPITRRVLGMTCSWQELCMSTDVKWIKKDFISIFNREIGKTERIDMLGKNASKNEIEYKNNLLEENLYLGN